MGLAGSGATSGVAPGQFEVLGVHHAAACLGWVFVPFYLKSGVFTMPEFSGAPLQRRARGGTLATVSILAYVLTKISVTIFAGAIVFSAIGVDFWVGALLVVVHHDGRVHGLRRAPGGPLHRPLADVHPDRRGRGGHLRRPQRPSAGGASLDGRRLEPGFLDMWKPMSDPDFPWTGILFGAPILGIWYWCTDQFIVQRTLSAKTIDDARRGTIMAGFLKLLPLFIFVLPGMLAATLVAQGQIALDDPNEALPTLVSALLAGGRAFAGW